MLTASTIDEFRLSFISLRGEFDLDHKHKSWEELITIADRRYQSLLDANKWIKVNPDKAGAALTAQGLKPKPTNVTCHKCGKKGHYAKHCHSKTKVDDTKSDPPAADAVQPKADAWKTKPPAKDGAHMKTVDNREWFWCGKCSRWTLSHLTDAHRGPAPKNPASNLSTNTDSDKVEGKSGFASGSLSYAASGF